MLIRGLFDRLVLLVAVLAGGALPGFVQQYRQRIGGRLDEARAQLAEWQGLADRLFGGDLSSLIAHHRKSDDAAFVAEGELIMQVHLRVLELEQTFLALQGSLWERAVGFVGHARWDDVQATWAIFQPDFPLHPETMLFALCFGGAIWMLWMGTIELLLRFSSRQRRTRHMHVD